MASPGSIHGEPLSSMRRNKAKRLSEAKVCVCVCVCVCACACACACACGECVSVWCIIVCASLSCEEDVCVHVCVCDLHVLCNTNYSVLYCHLLLEFHTTLLLFCAAMLERSLL